MVAACSSPALVALSNRLEVHLPNVTPGPEWVAVECASKKAYGCGELGERLMYGLSLLVRRVGSPNLSSSLSIDLSYEALRSIQEDLGFPDHLQGAEGILPEIDGVVKIAKNQVLVLMLVFRYRDQEKRVYYLVYDATDASLYLIPYIPDYLEGSYKMAPVPVRPASGRGHELALAARKFWPQPGAERTRLCLCTPATRENPSTDGPWEIKMHGKLPPHFSVDAMFSLEDKIFWADLSRGVAYSDLRQGGSVVDVAFIKLPDGCQIDYRSLPQIDPVKMRRTMACVEGSIKFVCIDCGVTPPGTKIVKAWTLDLDCQEWKEEEGFTCAWEELWMKVCVMNARLKDVPLPEPQYPVLMPDGALCLLLARSRHKICSSVKRPDYICSFDMFSKSCLCFGYVHNYHLLQPVILPSDFFRDCNPAVKRKPPTLKRKMPTLKRKLPSINVQNLSSHALLSEEGN